MVEFTELDSADTTVAFLRQLTLGARVYPPSTLSTTYENTCVGKMRQLKVKQQAPAGVQGRPAATGSVRKDDARL